MARTLLFAGLQAVLMGALGSGSGSGVGHTQSAWRQRVTGELPLMGHRNWIVIVDSAYPLQSSPGIETIDTGEDQLAVLDYVLAAVRGSRHVRALAHTDRELEYVPESEAPGVTRYREQLRERLRDIPADAVLHQSLIDSLNRTGAGFHVLVLKTSMTIPYTSVFLELDCRYWGADSEARLRERMRAEAPAAR